MDNWQRKLASLLSLFILFIEGCSKPTGATYQPKVDETTIGLDTTIGSLIEVFAPHSIMVEGYGLVGGLKGTGSEQCPPEIRAYLKRYILQQLPEQKINAEELIHSRDTAVVLIQGIIPTAASKNQRFDIKISALPGTQTTSLEGGWLYTAELKETGRFGLTTKVLAKAEGPVFIDTLGTSATNKKVGYVLGGGKVLDEYRITLALRRPDYKIVSLIRNRINERFGGNAARAVSPGLIELKVPAKYYEQKQRFISIVKAMYLNQTPEATKKRISAFIRQLAVSSNKYASEIALEAIGNESIDKLAALLNSSDEQVRLRAARCMLNLGSDLGLDTLREIALNKDSPYRVQALQAITKAGRHKDAAAICRRLLRDADFDIRLAAYEQLRKLDDITIHKKLIGQSFYLEEILPTQYKGIFVTRSGQPRIVLFGAPLYCRDNIFIQSADGSIIINAPAGQKYVSLIRKHPKRPDVVMRLKSSFELSDIIRTLCDEPIKKDHQDRPGLGVSYADMIALLKQMCQKGAVEAQFRAGPLPKLG